MQVQQLYFAASLLVLQTTVTTIAAEEDYNNVTFITDETLKQLFKIQASISPMTKDNINRQWKKHSVLPLSLTKPTQKGDVRGILLRTSLKQTVAAFLGIPYAKPPVENLRFKPPQDTESWEDVRDATRQPPSCYQREDLFFADFEGAKEQQPRIQPSEDCLYLNVFVPEVATDSNMEVASETYGTGGKKQNMSVMIWIHGGGFHSGSSLPNKGSGTKVGQSNWTPDPRELAAEGNIIVVTLQYRLGSFGFMFLADENAPGNVGLLDQQKAIMWVKNNIHNFGGDPSSITVTGQEAGGISGLIHHLKTPHLFQRLIVHSAGNYTV